MTQKQKSRGPVSEFWRQFSLHLPPPPPVLGPEHAANGCRATPARHAQHSTAGGKYLQFSGRQLRRDKSVLWSQPAATISAPHRTNTYRAAHSDSVLANNTSSMLRRWAGQC